MKAPAKAVQEKNPQRDGKIPFLCGFILYHMGKPFDFPIWYKIIIALRRRGSMSLPRPAAGGESCKQDSFLCVPHAEDICRYAAYGMRSE